MNGSADVLSVGRGPGVVKADAPSYSPGIPPPYLANCEVSPGLPTLKVLGIAKAGTSRD